MVPFLGTLNVRCRIIIGIQKGIIVLTTTHMEMAGRFLMGSCPSQKQFSSYPLGIAPIRMKAAPIIEGGEDLAGTALYMTSPATAG